MALTTIDDRGLKTPIDLLDNEKIRFGTGNDLEIYHSGAHTFLVNTTGALVLKGADVNVQNTDGDKLAYFHGDIAELWYNNSKKLETTSTGATVTGTIEITEKVQVVSASGIGRVRIGSGNASGAQILLDGDSNGDFSGNDYCYIEHNADGDLVLGANNPAGDANCYIKVGASDEYQARFNAGGSAELRYNNVKKFETTADGVQITGDVGLGVAPDNVGSARTLHIKGPSGEPAAIRLQSAGDTADTDDMTIYKTDTNAYLRVNGTDPLRFYMNGADKLMITSAGLVKIENDTGKFTCGAGDDLEIYHNGSNSIIDDTGSGALIIRTDNALDIKDSDNVMMAAFNKDADVKLYHDGSEKFKTNSGGVEITGHVYFPDNNGTYFGAGEDLKIYHNGSDSYITNATGGLNIASADSQPIYIRGGENMAETMAVFNDNGVVKLYYDNSAKLETADHGVDIKDNEFRIGPNSGSGSDCWIRLGSHGTDTDTHAVLAYDADDNYISIVVSGEAHNNGGIKVANGGNTYAAAFHPHADNSYNMGAALNRWSTIYAQNALNTSDRNLKNTIQTSDLGLSFINQLNPVSYKFNLYEGQVQDTRTHYGLIAQEVEDVIKKEGKTTDDFAAIVAEEGRYNLAYSEMISPLIKAIQELSAKVAALEAK